MQHNDLVELKAIGYKYKTIRDSKRKIERFILGLVTKVFSQYE